VFWPDTRVTLALELINRQGAEEEKAFVPCSSSSNPVASAARRNWKWKHVERAFRRFRTTYLCKQRAPEGLVQFWLGRAGKSITDGYDRVRARSPWLCRAPWSCQAGAVGSAPQRALVHRLQGRVLARKRAARNREPDAVGQNRSRSIQWAEKQENFQPKESVFS
jgi:hypothetical protein